MILEGDCIEQMRELDEASVDAIVCDPPYGLEFMGKEWDRFDGDKAWRRRVKDESDDPDKDWGVFNRTSKNAPHLFVAGRAAQEWHHTWATEALRVLKPGGHLLAFGGTRTYHRLACAVEDAGFEIRDSVIWLYGSGFPKSLDVSKAIDKAAGAEREVVGTRPQFPDGDRGARPRPTKFPDTYGDGMPDPGRVEVTAPATPEAQRWQGWGTALKPSHEPIVVARKPLAGTVAANVTEHGTGALNVDGCRVAGTKPHREVVNQQDNDWDGDGPWKSSGIGSGESAEGRWPSNLILSHLPECERVGERRVKPIGATARTEKHGMGNILNNSGKGKAHPGYRDADGLETVEAWECAPGCPVAELDRQSGEVGANGGSGEFRQHAWMGGDTPQDIARDKGHASRFFYTAKASRAERNAGLDGLPEKQTGVMQDDAYKWERDGKGNTINLDTRARNSHPTVKPIDLMRWLVRLVTPPGGTILDPFTGSGTTGIAAHLEGFSFIGIERESEYVEIARARIAWWEQFPPGTATDAALGVEARERVVRESGQGSLLGEVEAA